MPNCHPKTDPACNFAPRWYPQIQIRCIFAASAGESSAGTRLQGWLWMALAADDASAGSPGNASSERAEACCAGTSEVLALARERSQSGAVGTASYGRGSSGFLVGDAMAALLADHGSCRPGATWFRPQRRGLVSCAVHFEPELNAGIFVLAVWCDTMAHSTKAGIEFWFLRSALGLASDSARVG